MSQITDSYTFNIQVIEHGIAHIVLPVVYPTSVEKNTPFDIVYTVQNTGTVTDTLYGHILVGGSELAGSAWTLSLAPNATTTRTYHDEGISVNTQFLLEVGHQ